jgi:GTPase SAR1 family protein
VIARTWSRRLALRTSDPAVFQALRYLECDPEIAGQPAQDLAISVEPDGSDYRIVENGEVVGDRMSAQSVTGALHAKLMDLSLDEFPAAPIIHAASLRAGGRRVLLVGPKGAGKTVLTLHLIRAGYDVEGDENVFVTPDGVVPRPRALRVKESSASLLSHLGAALSEAPYYQSSLGPRIYNLDPRRAGASFWRIGRGAVDAVVLVCPKHGGDSSMRPVSSLALVQKVIVESGFPTTERVAAVGAIIKVIGNAKGYELSLGDLGGAVAAIGRVAEELA